MKTYPEAMHAVQTGIAMEIARRGEHGAGCSPKHLREGINSAMVSQTALVELLIAKGVFTLAEYMQALTRAANAEVERYEEMLSQATGKVIKLL